MNKYKLMSSVFCAIAAFVGIKSGIDNVQAMAFVGFVVGLFLPMARQSKFKLRFLLSAAFLMVGFGSWAGAVWFMNQDKENGIAIFGLIAFVCTGVAYQIGKTKNK